MLIIFHSCQKHESKLEKKLENANNSFWKNIARKLKIDVSAKVAILRAWKWFDVFEMMITCFISCKVLRKQKLHKHDFNQEKFAEATPFNPQYTPLNPQNWNSEEVAEWLGDLAAAYQRFKIVGHSQTRLLQCQAWLNYA